LKLPLFQSSDLLSFRSRMKQCRLFREMEPCLKHAEKRAVMAKAWANIRGEVCRKIEVGAGLTCPYIAIRFLLS